MDMDIDINMTFFILLNIWYRDKTAFISIVSSLSSDVFLILYDVSQIFNMAKNNFTKVNLELMGFKDSEIQQFLEPGLTMGFFSDIVNASKYRTTLEMDYNSPITTQLKNFIQNIKTLKNIQFYEWFEINLDNMENLKEISIFDIQGHGTNGLHGNSFKNNKKWTKANLHFSSIWNSNHKLLETLFIPTTKIREIYLSGTDLGDKFFASLKDKDIKNIVLDGYYTKTQDNQFSKFLKSQENNLEEIDFRTHNKYSPDLLDLADDKETVFTKLKEITISTNIQTMFHSESPHYDIKGLVRMFKTVKTINFYFNKHKEIITLIRVLSSFQNVTIINFITKNFEYKKRQKRFYKRLAKKIRKIKRKLSIFIDEGDESPNKIM